ncbi:MAG TPA: hypothetical protein VFS02_13705 [Telluria sp.]|nr:hypothetical protein [Telluria sp.]
MDRRSILVLIFVVLVPLMVFLAWKWSQIFNSPDGERYLKRRMQAPFTPLSAQDNADDDARKL